MTVVITADIVGSRALADRGRAQHDLEQAFARAEGLLPAACRLPQPLRATVGDEFQAVCIDVASAIAVTLLYRLALPAGIDVRFGIGVGETVQVPSRSGELSEGSAWWAAREAVEHVEALAQRALPQARTWIVAAADDSHERSSEGKKRGADGEVVRIANAGLLARDRIVGKWSARTRRLVFGRLSGATQLELAESEKITQSAVSQALSAAGATAITAAFAELIATASVD